MVSADDPTARPAEPGLRVGYVPGVTLTKWRRVWAERLPGVPLEVVPVDQARQREELLSGRVAMCFVRLPLDTDGLHLIPLYDEVTVVVAPKDHPVAAYDELKLADLAGEPLIPDSPDAFDRVGWGAGLLLVPHSVARSVSRRDLVLRPVSDADPTTVGLAWPVEPVTDGPGARADLIEEFIGIVRGRRASSSRTAADRAARGEAAAAADRSPGRKARAVSRTTPGRPPRPGGRRPRRRR